MQLVLNGQHRQVDPGLTIQALVLSLSRAPEGRGVAVAVDGEVVPRAAWEGTVLEEGARVEVVAAVQGG
ncbi:MAG TPA: sulfur carrier protein ThiS [Solirubrobacteraceae bacterium]|nr:sulfur carrier protein ThiS [Solirubrobacteraceae bacterium]